MRGVGFQIRKGYRRKHWELEIFDREVKVNSGVAKRNEDGSRGLKC